MKKLLLLLLFATQISFTQNEDIEKLNNTSNYVTLEPLTPFNYDLPRYRFGYIRTLNEKWKTGIHLGYGNDAISFAFDPSRDSEDYQLIDVRLEAYYMLKVRKKATDYISFEVFYINNKETIIDDYYFLGDREIRISYDRVNYRRNKYGAHIKAGSFIRLWEKVGLNIYFGVGIRVRNNAFTNAINPMSRPFEEDEDDGSYIPSTQNYFRQEGSRVGVNLTAGISLYYRLN